VHYCSQAASVASALQSGDTSAAASQIAALSAAPDASSLLQQIFDQVLAERAAMLPLQTEMRLRSGSIAIFVDPVFVTVARSVLL
jgi:hypothetical protein